MNFLPISAALELLLVIAEGTFPELGKFLPLGGSHLAQIGILFGVPWAVFELATAVIRSIRGADGG